MSPLMVSVSYPNKANSYFWSSREVKSGNLHFMHIRNQITLVFGLKGARVRRPGMKIKFLIQVEAVSTSNTSDVSSNNLAHDSCLFADTFPQSLKKTNVLGDNSFPY